MSRYRDDRDDYYGGDRYGERPPAPREGRGGGERDYEDYGRGRDYRDRDYFARDYPTSAVGRRGERQDYEGGRRYEEGERDRRDYDESREGREFFRRPAPRRGRTARSHLRCRDIMTRDVTVATRETTLEQVARMMREEDTGVIPVVERPAALTDLAETRPDINRVEPNVVGGNKLVGLITDRDIVIRAVADGKDARAVRAGEIMTTDIHSAHPNDRVIDAVRKMGDKQVRRIPVVDHDGNLRGIISMADVALETDDDRELAEVLEEISSGHSFWNRIFG